VKFKLSFTNIVAWTGKLPGVPTVKIYEKRCAECVHEFRVFWKRGLSMMAEWSQLSTITKIFYIGGLISFLGLAIINLTGMTSIGDISTCKIKLCPWCM
jgi:hypothetical protein